MSISSFLVRNVTYPLWMLKDGRSEILRFVNHFQFIDKMDRTSLLARQKEKTKAILIHAYKNTVFYKTLFDAIGFDPYKMKDPEDIQAVPLLTKDIIRSHHDDLIAKNLQPDQVEVASTGGSTGVPLSFLRDRRSIHIRKGQELFFDRWMGYRLGDKVSLFVAASHFDGVADRLKARVRNATCERTLRFDPHNITESYMELFLKDFLRFHPTIIKCFPNSLRVFASYLNKKGIKPPPVTAISCTGETLYAHQREMFQETFGGEVFEKVGTRESGIIACECRLHNGMHVFTEGVFMELLDPEGNHVKPGEPGRVVITDLLNEAMPLIRYDLGDMAIASDGRYCQCGSPLPLVEKWLGRDRDIIVDSYGNPKPGYLFTEVIMEMNLSTQFQIVQPDRENLMVRIVQNNDEVDFNLIRRQFQEIIGPKIRITFEPVREIRREPSGKYAYVKSLVSY